MMRLGGTFEHVAHSLIHGPDGSKLSKRHGAWGGCLPRHGVFCRGVAQYLVRLGWSHGDQEIFSTEEMIAISTCRAWAARRHASILPSWKTSTATISVTLTINPS